MRMRHFALSFLFAGLLGFSCGRAATGERTPLAIPDATNVLAGLARSHPRLLASAADFAALRQRSEENRTLKGWITNLHRQAGEILRAEPSKYEIPDGLRLLATSRRVLERMYVLGLLYRLEGGKEYSERAWKELETAAAFRDWNPRHFLDTAEMTHAFAIGYDWFYDAWSPEQRTLLEHTMVEKGFGPALKIYHSGGGWARARHNWNQVCNGGIGMGALAIGDVQPAISGEVLHDGLESIQLAMEEFAPDGAWKEGPGYWNYATAYNVALLAGLQTALGKDFGLSSMPAFGQTGLFPIYLTGPLDLTFNYADGGEHKVRAAQMFWLAQRFHEPAFAKHEMAAAPPAPQDVLWFDPAMAETRGDELPLSKYFRGAEVAVMRSAWNDKNASFVGFKAGDNKANHSHLDLGTFVFDAEGTRWAPDLGADDYNLPGYFGSQRWHYYRLRAEGHNTLVINPSNGPDQDPKAAGRITRFKDRPGDAFAVADLTAAYKDSAEKWWRGIALKQANLLVQDEVQTKHPSEVWWFMHTLADAKLGPDGRSAVLTRGSAALHAQILAPSEARFMVMDAEPLTDSPHPEKQARNVHMRKLAIHLQRVSNLRLVVSLSPGVSENEPAGEVKGLSEW